jgi:hypothetical protein
MLHSILSTLLVMLGIGILNITEQSSISNSLLYYILGMLIMALGWIYVVYAYTINKILSLGWLLIGSMIFTIITNQYLKKVTSTPLTISILFTALFIILGNEINVSYGGYKKYGWLIVLGVTLLSIMKLFIEIIVIPAGK